MQKHFLKLLIGRIEEHVFYLEMVLEHLFSLLQKKKGVLSSTIFSDGKWKDSLYADGGPSLNQRVGKIRMNGQDIFKQAVKKLSEATLDALYQCNLSIKDIDWFIPHQANQRIIVSTAKKLGIPENKTISSVRLHANTSAASIPLAMSCAHKSGKKKKMIFWHFVL